MNKYSAKQLVDADGHPTDDWQFICQSTYTYTPVGFCMLYNHKHESALEAFVCFLNYCLQHRTTIDKLDVVKKSCDHPECTKSGEFLVTIYPLGWIKQVCKKHLNITDLITLFKPDNPRKEIITKHSII